ncbi:MAG TPA: Ig-like domain-containing protein, partial [Lachnospiraceae bacterium]|nr:Ig-like domain-containing protein [Lachnospiraceae bacterium]
MKKVLINKRLKKFMSVLLTAAIVFTTLFSNVMDTNAEERVETMSRGAFTVSVNPSTIDVGGTASIEAINVPGNSDGVDYSTLNSGVASISGKKVTGKGAGTATITATAWVDVDFWNFSYWIWFGYSFGDKATIERATRTVTVNAVAVPITGVTLNNTSINLTNGETSTLTASVNPNTTTLSQDVTWASNETTVATVDESGIVTAIKSGEAIITATSVGDDTKFAICTVTVANPVTSITLSPTTTSIEMGSSSLITATIAPAYVDDATITWTSSNESVATVKDSVVSAVGKGTATITATSVNSVSATCDVTVTVPTTGVSLNKVRITVAKDSTETLVATVLPEDAETKTVKWVSSDLNIATVNPSENETGNVTVTGKSIGSATITVTASNGSTATCIVDVGPAVVEAKFYILNSGLSYPGLVKGDGTKLEIVSGTPIGNPSNNYISVGNGKFNYAFDHESFAEEYSKQTYDNKIVEGNIASYPDLSAYIYDTDRGNGFHEIGSVDWYVIKKLSDGWHIDGKAIKTTTAIEYSVDYQVSVSDNEFVSVGTDTRTVEEVKALKPVSELENVDGCYFAGWYWDTECTNRVLNNKILTSVQKNTTVYGKWIPKTAITITATPGTLTYSGVDQTYESTEFSGIPAGLTITGLTSSVTGNDAGSYTTTTNTSGVTVMQGSINVTDQYIVSVTEATFTIEKATITVTADDASRAYGEENPAFTWSITGVVAGDAATHTMTDFTATTEANESSEVGEYTIVPSLKVELASLYVNYRIEATNGILTVREAKANQLTTSDKTVVYDGTEQSVFTATTKIEGSKIQYGLTDSSGKVIGDWLDQAPSFKDVGTYKVLVKATKKNYESEKKSETLTITKAPITVTANNVTIFYKQVPVKTVNVKGIVKADTNLKKSDFTASITGKYNNPGTYKNVIIPALKNNAKDNYSNYEIKYINGDLKIVKAPGFMNGIHVWNVKATFDNNPHIAYEATAEKGSTIYYSTDLGLRKSWSKTIPSFTESGSYVVFVKATHKGYEDSYSVELVVINKAKQTVTFKDKTVTFEPGKKQTLDRAKTYAKESKYSETLVQYRVDGKSWTNKLPSYTDAGTYKIFVKVKNRNYEDVTKSATLTISPSDKNGVSANNIETTYNGKEHGFVAESTISGSTVKYNTAKVDGTFDENAWTTVSPNFTDAGTYPVAVRVENKNYVTKEATYTVTIIPAEVLITVNNMSKIVGTADPIFTGNAVVANEEDYGKDKFTADFGTVTYERIAAHKTSNKAGDKVTITAKYTENKNYVVTVVDGLLTINAKPITPTTPTTPAAPTTP